MNQCPSQNNDKLSGERFPYLPMMYQCGLCSVKFQHSKELIDHVEKREHYQTPTTSKNLKMQDLQSPTTSSSFGSALNFMLDKCSPISEEYSGNSIGDRKFAKSNYPKDYIKNESNTESSYPSFIPTEDTEMVPNLNASTSEEEPKNLVKREQSEISQCSSTESEGIVFSIGISPNEGANTSATSTVPIINEKISSDKQRPAFYKCIKCPATFDTSLGLRNHRSAHSLDCPYCEDSFYIKPSLDRHIREKHEKEEKEALIDTPVVFASDVLIDATSDGSFSCKICGKICAARSDMQKHVRRHTDERPFQCTICSESFKQRSAITNHMRIHSGEKPFSCSYSGCGKRFSQPSNKRRHEALHRGERPFSCDQCNRSFSEKTTLQTHTLQHTGDRPFICNICGKGHITNSALNSHKRSRHQLLSEEASSEGPQN